MKTPKILAEVENFIDGIRYYLDKGNYIKSCYSNEEEVVVNIGNEYDEDYDAICSFSLDGSGVQDVLDYYNKNLSKVAERISNRLNCARAVGAPENNYLRGILRTINNIIRGEDDPINKRR